MSEATSYQSGDGEHLVEITKREEGKKKKVSIKVSAPLMDYEGVIWSFELEAGKVSNVYGRYVSDPSRMFEPESKIDSLDELLRHISIDSCYRLFEVAKHLPAYAERSERTRHFEKFGKELRKKLLDVV